MGSLKRIHGTGDDPLIINKNTGKRVNDVLVSQKIRDDIKKEEEAWEIIRTLRDRCVKPQMHNPTDEELHEAIKALRILWKLLPPIERHQGEKNKSFFIRTLHEVGEFRMVDMFHSEK